MGWGGGREGGGGRVRDKNENGNGNEKLTRWKIERIPYLTKQERRRVLRGNGNLEFHEIIYYTTTGGPISARR